MKAGAAAGGGLVLGFFMPGAGRFANAQQPPAKVYEPNAFLHIAPDNTVTVRSTASNSARACRLRCRC
jgi:isoquinoline 1-oxidoreductase beta subunit